MVKKYFGDLGNRIESPEKGEAMPAAIVTAAVSTILILGIAIVMSMVSQSRSEEAQHVELASIVSSLDVSLQSDITQASFISPSTKLVRPSNGAISADDLLLNGVTMHIPSSNGECKVIKWSVDGTTVNRDLLLYGATLNADKSAKCDETSEIVADRKKVFSDKFLLQEPFTFSNSVGRELAYALDEITLEKVNEEMETELTTQGTDRLSEADFNELNKLITSDNLVSGFAEADTCAMDAAKVEGVCPIPESVTVSSAWNSDSIGTISVAFELTGYNGEIISHDIEQSSSITSR